MTDYISPNSREAIGAHDPATGFFYVEGTSSSGAINVNVAGSASTLDSNLTEIDGNPVAVNAGNSDNGTQRVVIASDQTPIETLEQTGMVPFEFDYIEASYPTVDTDVFEYYQGGSGGTLVATVTAIYTDSGKTDILTVTRT